MTSMCLRQGDARFVAIAGKDKRTMFSLGAAAELILPIMAAVDAKAFDATRFQVGHLLHMAGQGQGQGEGQHCSVDQAYTRTHAHAHTQSSTRYPGHRFEPFVWWCRV